MTAIFFVFAKKKCSKVVAPLLTVPFQTEWRQKKQKKKSWHLQTRTDRMARCLRVQVWRSKLFNSRVNVCLQIVYACICAAVPLTCFSFSQLVGRQSPIGFWTLRNDGGNNIPVGISYPLSALLNGLHLVADIRIIISFKTWTRREIRFLQNPIQFKFKIGIEVEKFVHFCFLFLLPLVSSYFSPHQAVPRPKW